MKVTISVHGRFHAFELARGLDQAGLLDQLLTTYPAFSVRDFIKSGTAVKSAALLEMRRRLYSKTGWGGKPDLLIAKRFAHFAKKNLLPASDLFVGWSSASLEAIEPARAAGARVIIERGSTHIAAQTDVLRDAYKAFGLAFSDTNPEIIDREEREYALADKISVPSSYAAKTFIDRGFDADKIMVNGLGVDLHRFQPPPARPLDRLPRIVFAGGVGIRKGVPWLLEAFAPLSSKAELHVMGPVAPDFRKLLRKMALQNVYIRGAIAGDQLAAEYSRADIFCLPSIEEGYGLVIPQAMACGLPIVTTEVVGAVDLLTVGRDALIVPPCDAQALSLALEQLVDDAELRVSMGTYAHDKVQSGQSWEDYVRRTIVSYQEILA